MQMAFGGAEKPTTANKGGTAVVATCGSDGTDILAASAVAARGGAEAKWAALVIVVASTTQSEKRCRMCRWGGAGGGLGRGGGAGMGGEDGGGGTGEGVGGNGCGEAGLGGRGENKRNVWDVAAPTSMRGT